MFFITISALGWTYWNKSNLNTTVQCLHSWDQRNMSLPWIGKSKNFPEGYLSHFGFFDGTESATRSTFRAGTPIEVIRMDTRMFPEQYQVEIGVAWFYYAPGSNVFINLSSDPLIVEEDTPILAGENPSIHNAMAKAGVEWIVRLDAFPKNPRTEIILLTGRNQLTKACDLEIPYTCPCIEYHGLATCDPKNMMFRAEMYCTDSENVNYLLADGMAILGSIVAGALLRLIRFDRKWKWLLIGLAVWLPANVIGDSLALLVFVTTSSIAAMVTVGFQVGNLPLLIINRQNLSDSFLRLSINVCFVVGMLSLMLCVVAANAPAIESNTSVNSIVTVAAIFAGSTGAIGSTSLWAGAKAAEDVRYLSVGMSLGCAVSGFVLLLAWSFDMKPHAYFTGGTMIYAACVGAGGSAPVNTEEELQDESNENLIKEDEAPTLQGPPLKIDLGNFCRIFFILYACNYFVPAIWPYVVEDPLAYTIIIIAVNASDTLGRVLNFEALQYSFHAYVLWGVGCVAAIVQMYAWWPPKVIVLVGIAALIVGGTILRGALITSIQQNVRSTRESWQVGSFGQLGGVVGSLLGLLLALTK